MFQYGGQVTDLCSRLINSNKVLIHRVKQCRLRSSTLYNLTLDSIITIIPMQACRNIALNKPMSR